MSASMTNGRSFPAGMLGPLRRSLTCMADASALVLHSHLPYVRGAGRWRHGEEWVHEAILGTYLPLLVLLHDLRAEGVRYRLTIGLTPTLIEQLADPDIYARFVTYAADHIRRAELDAWDFGVSRAPASPAVAAV